MSVASPKLDGYVSRQEFRRWCEARPKGRFERVDTSQDGSKTPFRNAYQMHLCNPQFARSVIHWPLPVSLGGKPMKLAACNAGRMVALALLLCVTGLFLATSIGSAQPQFSVKPVAEKKVSQLPAGPLYWQIENFPTLAQAQAAEGPTSLATEVAGKVWLCTLGLKNAAAHGGSKVAEIGPVPPIMAPEYLLRLNNVAGPPGAKTPVHTHPGSETFYVIAGRLGQKSPHGVAYVEAGQSMPGHGPGMPMEVSSAGTGDLNAIVMFFVDATQPFSSPAKLE